ncbi:MAG: DUF1501 domain-containing protein [Candidatus Accumulibacter sp. UW26]|jgi:uncharacterized protein (DUF1501 family)
MNPERRRWLQAALAIGGLSVTHAWAVQGHSDPGGRLLFIFLRGGLDGLFAFSPVSDPRFAELRPSLAETVMTQGVALADTGFVAHPACTPLVELFRNGELSFAPCAGTVDVSRSHFQAQDLFELGSGRPHGPSGFMSRAANELGGRRGAISFTREIPLAFRGGQRLPEVSPLGGSGFRLPPGALLEAIRRSHGGERTGDALEQAIATEADITAALAEGGMEVAAARGAPAVSGFSRVARDMARVLRANPRFSLAFIDLGGFDTHANQAPVLARALASLSEGLVVLRNELGADEWRRTRVVVSSEFGRTVRENGTRGTDHGHGGLLLMAGGGLHGGRLLGGFDSLDDVRLNEARDLPVLLDWRDALASAMQDSLGLSPAALDRTLPGRPRRRSES